MATPLQEVVWWSMLQLHLPSPSSSTQAVGKMIIKNKAADDTAGGLGIN